MVGTCRELGEFTSLGTSSVMVWAPCELEFVPSPGWAGAEVHRNYR